ncbi:MAG TPA: glycosyltransferase family 39 protein [Acidobacteriaceae bacterium]|nr:glycosyltransferase family 39 protein [Acidobacteriaceae bacterium]
MRVAGGERRVAAGLTLLVVALRVWFARKVTFCGTPDSCYALGVAQDLTRYHSFRVPFLFDLQLNHLQVPNTGLEYWRPGVSLLFALLRPLGGVTLHGALVIATLAGVVWASAAWFIGERATGSRKIALASYALCLLFSPGWGGSLTPDPTLFYAAAIAWFLALFTVKRQGLVQDILALVCVGAAYMIRNDAGLLLIPLIAVLWLRWRAVVERRRNSDGGPSGVSVAYAIAMLVGFGLALAPMHLLYRHVLGTAFPAGAGQALYLNDLSDFTTYGVPVNVHTMLSHGLKHLVTMRVGATALIVYRVLALVLGYPALVFLPALAVRRDGDAGGKLGMPELAGPVAFGVTVLVVYCLVLPAVGVFSALRSSTALLPAVAVVVVLAILRVAKTRRLAGVLMATVATIYLVSGVMDDRRSIDPMNQIGEADRAQARALEAMGATDDPGSTIVMTPDPVQFSVTTGLPAIPMPANGLDAITKEALDLHASHAILDGEHLPGSPAEVTDRLHPVQARTIEGQTVLLLELPRELRQR